MQGKNEGMSTRSKQIVYSTPKKEKGSYRLRMMEAETNAIDRTISTKEEFTVKKISESPFTKFASGLSPLDILNKENPTKELFISNPLAFDNNETYPLKLYTKFKSLDDFAAEHNQEFKGKFEVNFRINKNLNRKTISRNKTKKVLLNSINSFYSDLKTPIRNQFDYSNEGKMVKNLSNRKPFEETGKCNCKKSK